MFAETLVRLAQMLEINKQISSLALVREKMQIWNESFIPVASATETLKIDKTREVSLLSRRLQPWLQQQTLAPKFSSMIHTSSSRRVRVWVSHMKNFMDS